jgi:hypothetical protein
MIIVIVLCRKWRHFIILVVVEGSATKFLCPLFSTIMSRTGLGNNDVIIIVITFDYIHTFFERHKYWECGQNILKNSVGVAYLANHITHPIQQ